MPLELYRRHSGECLEHLGKRHGQDKLTPLFLSRHKRCDCPVWMRGRTRSNEEVRESCKTRDWDQAGQVSHERFEGRKVVEKVESLAPKVESLTLEEALKRWLDEKATRRKSTQLVYERNAQKLIAFLTSLRVFSVREVTVDHITALRHQCSAIRSPSIA